jgi:hypothetical protein
MKVIDCAVEDDAALAAGREHRLAAHLAQIEDSQSPVPEHSTGPCFYTFTIRPATRERTGHTLDRSLCGCLIR